MTATELADKIQALMSENPVPRTRSIYIITDGETADIRADMEPDKVSTILRMVAFLWEAGRREK